MKIGILGGGLTGLSLGYFLDEKGIDFEILEKDDECGGLCRSFEENGFFFDIGGHIIFSKDNKVMNFMLDVLNENKVKVRRNTKILYKGIFVKYPFENGLSDLTKEENEECLNEFMKTLSQKYKKPKNFKEWLYQTFGKGISEKYLIPYNEKIWNFKTENMATFWVDGRIPKPPAEDIINSSKGMVTEGYTHQLYFWYPIKGGIQALTSSIEQKINKKITRSFDVKEIRKKNNEWIISDGRHEKIFSRLISTIPIFHLAEAFATSENINDKVSRLKYNSLITVNLGLDIDNLNEFSWLYIPDIEILAHRAVFLKNNSKSMCPKGKSSVQAEITYNEGDEISKMSEEEIVNHVVKGLHERKIIDKNKVIHTSVHKTRYAYVVYDLEYENNIKAARDYFESNGILLCGRFSEYEYLNMDFCIKHAMNMAEKISIEKHSS